MGSAACSSAFTLVASKHNWPSKGVIGSGCAHRILKSRGLGRTWSEAGRSGQQRWRRVESWRLPMIARPHRSACAARRSNDVVPAWIGEILLVWPITQLPDHRPKGGVQSAECGYFCLMKHVRNCGIGRRQHPAVVMELVHVESQVVVVVDALFDTTPTGSLVEWITQRPKGIDDLVGCCGGDRGRRMASRSSSLIGPPEVRPCHW
jgi:hypothetical protein